MNDELFVDQDGEPVAAALADDAVDDVGPYTIELTRYADGTIRPKRSHKPEAVVERKRMFLEFMLSSTSMAEAARKMGIHRQTVVHWRNTDPQFRAALEQVKTVVAEETFIPAIRDLALGKTSKDNVPHFQALKFMVERLAPEDWGPRTNVSITNNVYHRTVPLSADPEAMPIIDVDGAILDPPASITSAAEDIEQ